MSIFESLKSKIFGHKKAAAPAARPAASGAAPAPAAAPAAVAAPVSNEISAVNVEAVLEDLATHTPQKLDWRHSIVDLMKLVGLDSSLANRKELATELGYTGDKSDSATMNIWLHKQVLRKLAENGGVVPRSMLD